MDGSLLGASGADQHSRVTTHQSPPTRSAAAPHRHIGRLVPMVRCDRRRLSERISSALRHGQHHLGRAGRVLRVHDGQVLVELEQAGLQSRSREWLFATELALID